MKKRSDGRYVKVITDPKTKKRISFYGTSVREVNQKLLAYEQKQEIGKTFAEIADEWWEGAEKQLANQTVGNYRTALRRATEYFGEDYIKDIASKDVQKFLNHLSKQGLAQKTIKNHLIVLNQIFIYAGIEESDIVYNSKYVKVPKGSGKTTRPPATPDEERVILDSDHPWLFPVIALLTGLRKGEILALQWKDIDFEQNIISITKEVEHINNRPHIKEPKTENGIRIVPLLNNLKKRLEPHIGDPDHYLFSDDGGISPLRKQRYNVLYAKYQRDVGIDCTAHQLRHSYATIAVEENAGVKELQNALGHADITTTMNIYTAVRKRNVENLANTLNAKYDQKNTL